MIRSVPLIVVLAVCISCKPAQPQASKSTASGPRVRATVVSIRTTLEPEKRAVVHTLVIAGDRVRNTGEHDIWRLYDTKANTITIVDDVERTIRTEPLSAVVRRRAAANDGPIPTHFPRPRLVRMNDQKVLHGTTARRTVIESGAWRRELWMAEHPLIPRGLFAMMQASEKPSSPLAPMMSAVDEALTAERGFPLADRTTVPVGKGNMIVDRTVVSIAEREVPESLMVLPKVYKDVTPRPAPAP